MDKASIYDYLAEWMLFYADVSPKKISYGKCRWLFSEFRIPKKMHMDVIKEMISMGLLERENQRGLHVRKHRINIAAELMEKKHGNKGNGKEWWGKKKK